MEKTSNSIDKINKKLGKDIAYKGVADLGKDVEPLSTGILPLDNMLGIGGFPKGRISEISGQFSTGKTSLCLAVIASAQRQGIQCAFIDAEYAFSSTHAENLGVNVDELFIIKPDCGEDVMESIEVLASEGVGLIVIDSVSAITPKAEVEAEVGKPTMGGQARLISQSLRRIIPVISKNKTVVIFINQLRQNIMGGKYDQYITSGGMALGFYSSVKLVMKKIKALVSGDRQVGQKMIVTTKKNKIAEPGRECELSYFFDTGFDQLGDFISIAEDKGILNKEGNTYYFDGEKLEVGREKTRQVIESDQNLQKKILSQLGLQLPIQE